MNGPERIWAIGNGKGGDWGTRNGLCHTFGGTEYIRADTVAEMIRQALAAQIEVDARIAEEEGWEPDKPHLGITEREEGSRDCAERIAAAIRARGGA